MTATTLRYGLYIGSTRFINRAKLTRAMIQNPSIATLPVLEVTRSGKQIKHPQASALNASNNTEFVVPDVAIPE